MKQLLLFFLLMGLFSVQGKNPDTNFYNVTLNAGDYNQNASDYTYKVIPSSNNTWGYDIYKGKKLFIHQACKPGLPGNEGFNTKSDAKKVALLVIEKLKKGEMPPSVTSDELENLKVL